MLIFIDRTSVSKYVNSKVHECFTSVKKDNNISCGAQKGWFNQNFSNNGLKDYALHKCDKTFTDLNPITNSSATLKRSE